MGVARSPLTVVGSLITTHVLIPQGRRHGLNERSYSNVKVSPTVTHVFRKAFT